MSGPRTAPYGSWPSPIDASQVARGKVKLGFPAVAGDRVWWEEARPDEAGRITVMSADGPGNVHDMLPPAWNARSRVHEYGGRSYLLIPPTAGDGSWRMVVASFGDQRLYLHDDGTPRALTPEPGSPGALRYADMTLSPDATEVWCIREQHQGGRISRAIVAVPLNGTAADYPEAVRVLVTGADFFAFPTPSPDGRHLAWICWDHPRMPWDGTELRVAPVSDLADDPQAGRLIMGGPSESVLAPAWRDAQNLYAVSDLSGWWNLYLTSMSGSAPAPLYRCEEEVAAPLWQLGGRPFAALADGRLAVLHGRGTLRLGLLDPDAATLDDFDLPVQTFQPALAAAGMTIAGVAGGPRIPWSVIRVETSGTARLLRQEVTSIPDPAYLPSPRPVHVLGTDHDTSVHALVYPPTNPAARAPDGERAPYVVWVHGGPTSCSVPVLDLEKVFFTSRGIGVIDVNHGGSSGYGRGYRERLRGQWGLVDVADAVTVVLALVGEGAADRARLAIRGASSGAWTALVSVTSGLARTGGEPRAADATSSQPEPVYAAAVSYFGATDRRLSATTTHDFESRYMHGLIGPWPEAEALYAARSPRGHVSAQTSPVLLLHGLDDPVIVPEHAEILARELAEHHVPHVHLTFAGEGHGFRRAETIVASLEAELSFYGQILGFSPDGITQPVVILA